MLFYGEYAWRKDKLKPFGNCWVFLKVIKWILCLKILFGGITMQICGYGVEIIGVHAGFFWYNNGSKVLIVQVDSTGFDNVRIAAQNLFNFVFMDSVEKIFRISTEAVNVKQSHVIIITDIIRTEPSIIIRQTVFEFKIQRNQWLSKKGKEQLDYINQVCW